MRVEVEKVSYEEILEKAIDYGTIEIRVSGPLFNISTEEEEEDELVFTLRVAYLNDGRIVIEGIGAIREEELESLLDEIRRNYEEDFPGCSVEVSVI